MFLEFLVTCRNTVLHGLCPNLVITWDEISMCVLYNQIEQKMSQLIKFTFRFDKVDELFNLGGLSNVLQI